MDPAVEDELEALSSIYPELQITREGNEQITLNLTIPITLDTEILIKHGDKTSTISHISPLELQMTLKRGYPLEKAPDVTLGNVSVWLDDDQVGCILRTLFEIWDDYHSAILYAYVDYVSSESRRGFGVFEEGKSVLLVDAVLFEYYNEEDKIARGKIFDMETIECEICQCEHKGYECTLFEECGHGFCNDCLKEYFQHIIERGEVENVHCPSIECTKRNRNEMDNIYKEAECGNIADFQDFEARFFQMVVKREVLARFLENRLIDRYEMLKKRLDMEKYQHFFPNRVSTCPRSICLKMFLRKDIDTKLVICPSCGFAFCNDCFHSWHGEMNSCSIHRRRIPMEDIIKWIEHESGEEYTDREICNNITFKYGRKIVQLAVREYIAEKQFKELIESEESDIIKCPHVQCGTYIQRSEGCNKMTCGKCGTFFCNLCGCKLNKSDPYEHYNDPQQGCFGRLFEGIVEER